MKPTSKIVLTFGLSCVVFLAAVAHGEEPAPGKQQSARLEVMIPITLDYLLYLPEDYEKQEACPLLLFLHGSGERGDDLELVKKHGPPKLIGEGKSFPFIVVSPQCPSGKRWDTLSLSVLLDDLEKKHKVDKDRIYVTGLSMGGFGTWDLAAETPGRFAAIVPICGGGEPRRTRGFGKLPVWVFHGADDPAVPVSRSEEMVEAIKSRDGVVKFTVYPDTGHDSWTATYNNPELYTWLLEQKLSQREKK